MLVPSTIFIDNATRADAVGFCSRKIEQINKLVGDPKKADPQLCASYIEWKTYLARLEKWTDEEYANCRSSIRQELLSKFGN